MGGSIGGCLFGGLRVVSEVRLQPLHRWSRVRRHISPLLLLVCHELYCRASSVGDVIFPRYHTPYMMMTEQPYVSSARSGRQPPAATSHSSMMLVITRTSPMNALERTSSMCSVIRWCEVKLLPAYQSLLLSSRRTYVETTVRVGEPRIHRNDTEDLYRYVSTCSLPSMHPLATEKGRGCLVIGGHIFSARK